VKMIMIHSDFIGKKLRRVGDVPRLPGRIGTNSSTGRILHMDKEPHRRLKVRREVSDSPLPSVATQECNQIFIEEEITTSTIFVLSLGKLPKREPGPSVACIGDSPGAEALSRKLSPVVPMRKKPLAQLYHRGKSLIS